MNWLLRPFKVSKTKWTWRWYIFSSKWFGVKIHKIRMTTDEWHTHPWNGVSIIFGHYYEQLEEDGWWHLRMGVNFVGANRPHRTSGDCYTLFIHGPRVNEDWFWGDEKAPWRGVQHEREAS